jgi:hypothetical protein
MSVFFIRPDPDNVAFQSRQFVDQEMARAHERVEAAEASLERAEIAHYADIDNQTLENQLYRAQQDLHDARLAHKAVFARHQWEMTYQWKRRIKVHPKAMPTPWKHDSSVWKAIFAKFRRPSASE